MFLGIKTGTKTTNYGFLSYSKVYDGKGESLSFLSALVKGCTEVGQVITPDHRSDFGEDLFARGLRAIRNYSPLIKMLCGVGL